jgi:hypothetical protein
MSYHYIQTEPGLWTVGTGTPHSEGGSDWAPESDHDSPRSAARRVAQLNGGGDPECDCSDEIAELRKRVDALEQLVQQTRADVGP